MNNIIITGFMATGKTITGRLLADKLNYKFIDTDQQIERVTQKSIPEIFALDGEAEFRRLEKLLLHWLIHYDNAVISIGGGMIVDPKNLANLKKIGKIICLECTPEIILSRIKNETHRPLLHCHNPLQKIKTLLSARQPYYKQADYDIDTSNLSVDEVVNNMLKWLKPFLIKPSGNKK